VRLAPLRPDLEIVPSPVPERPGLLLRDPFLYAEAMIIVPASLVPCLLLFDGPHDLAELTALLLEITGDPASSDLAEELHKALGGSGFLADETLPARRAENHRAFADAPRREARHAGSGYPDEPRALAEALDGYLQKAPAGAGPRPDLVGIAAPHVSPWGGQASYAAAYAALPSALGSRTFMVLGTSHHGQPERFGLTRKPYVTPFGAAGTDLGIVDELASAGGEAALMEDYCHRLEHSVEFQVVFLQHLFGPDVRVVPILCGPFFRSLAGEGAPEDDPGVARFLDVLRALAARRQDELFWVLGVDMAHIGRRYGDGFVATPGDRRLAAVESLDRGRCEALRAGNGRAFWEQVTPQGDPLRWCGSSALYTFVQAVRPARGDLLHYEQWAIDAHSVVTFGALAFS
jgi:MEMO1 family protein